MISWFDYTKSAAKVEAWPSLHSFSLVLYSPAMKSLVSFLPYAQIAVAAVLVAFILLQRTGAQIGGAFGGSDNWSSAYHTRRGLERGLFIGTIVTGIIFAALSLISLI
jgi:protein translocase SecG subunit